MLARRPTRSAGYDPSVSGKVSGSFGRWRDWVEVLLVSSIAWLMGFGAAELRNTLFALLLFFWVIVDLEIVGEVSWGAALDG